MKRTLMMFASVTTGGALIVAALPASAAVETFQLAFGSSSFPAALMLPEFNTAQGALTGISMTLTTTTTLEADVANFGQATTFTGATATGTTTITGLPGAALSETLSTTPYNGSIADGTTSPVLFRGQAVSYTGSTTAAISAASFSSYEYTGAPGSIVEMPFDVNFTGSYSGSGPGRTSPGLFFGGEANANGFVNVSYTYDAVPEPGSLWAGLCALGYGGFVFRGCLSRLRLNS